MCIVSIAWQSHPQWQLVVAGNRDELHARPSRPMARWDDDPALLAGRDELAGGTWLGVSEAGRFAVVTNVAGNRQPDPEMESRGLLLRDFLTGSGAHATVQTETFSKFSPFNLLTVDRDQAHLYSNRADRQKTWLDGGVFGLSNGPLNRPWPKSARLNGFVSEWLSQDGGDISHLMDRLADETPCPYDGDGHTDDAERSGHEQSPIFIRNAIYGTRCSSVVTIDRNGNGIFAERRFDETGAISGESQLEFSWPNQ